MSDRIEGVVQGAVKVERPMSVQLPSLLKGSTSTHVSFPQPFNTSPYVFSNPLSYRSRSSNSSRAPMSWSVSLLMRFCRRHIDLRCEAKRGRSSLRRWEFLRERWVRWRDFKSREKDQRARYHDQLFSPALLCQFSYSPHPPPQSWPTDRPLLPRPPPFH